MTKFSAKLITLLALLLPLSVYAKDVKNTEKNSVVFKAAAPIDSEEENKYGFGSIWPNKEKFFSNLSAKKSQKDAKIPAKKVENPQKKNLKKEHSWEAALTVLQSFPISYMNKESGIIKTDEAYVREFDKTDSCRYKVIVNISEEGETSVIVNSPDDSKTRLQKHEDLIKTRIVNAANSPAA